MSNSQDVQAKRSWLPKAHPVSWGMLAIGTSSMLLISIDRQILPTVLPAIMEEFGMNSTQGGFISSLNFIGTLLGAAIIGVVADSIGRGYKRTWAWWGSCFLAIISGLATFFTKGVFNLQLWRVVMGLGTGAMEPANVALVSDFWQKENRGFALGVNHTGMPLGQFIGPALLSVVLLYGGWRDAFLWIPAIGLLLILAQWLVGSKKNEMKVRGWIDEHDMTQPYSKADVENKLGVKQSFMNAVNSLKNRNIRLAITMDFLFLWTEMGVATFLTLYLMDHLGIGLAQAALISGASGITGWFGLILWGTVSDHIGRRPALGIVTVGFAATVFCLTFINSVPTAWAMLIIWGLFRNAPFAVINSLTVDSAPKEAASSLGFLVGIGYGLSGTLVSPVIGWVIDQWGYSTSYVILAISCLLVFIPLLMAKETAGRKLKERQAQD
ncbi:MFS transporter [Bifidobacterium catulorum]|nr:MFS transporter [Bifidobacterium catulorum]